MRIKRNAVLYKDLSIRSKRGKMPTLILALNIILSIISFAVMIAMNSQFVQLGYQYPKQMITMFQGFVIAESAIVCFIVPSATSATIAGEREQQTLDVLLTTKISPWDIIIGKYLSVISYLAQILISTLPIMMLSCIYGGVNFGQVLIIMFTMLTTGMYLSSFGIYFSARFKKSTKANLATFFTIFFVILMGSIFLVVIIYLIFALKNLTYNSGNNIKPHVAFFILYLNPATTVFDALGRNIGFNFFGEEINGMATIAEETVGISASNFFVKFWVLFSLLCQGTVTYFVLKASAIELDPLHRNIRKTKKET